MTEKYVDEKKNIRIEAASIEMGRDVSFGRNINVRLKGAFALGDRSRLGNDVEILGNHCRFGKDLFHSSGLRVGGGGRQHPNANLTIGDRCTIHDNFINVCEEIVIGDDVGLSPGVGLLSHGYWLSVLEGYPAKFAGVTIESGVIVGYRSLLMMGVRLGARSVIGSQSVVTKDTEADGIYAGNPAKLVRKVTKPSLEKQIELVGRALAEYRLIADYHGIKPRISYEHPIITVNECRFDVLALTCEGIEDEETDDFRDYIRKWGLRYYTDRPFRSVFSF